jgi:DNA-binding PadR family transcriptional regulator
MTRTLTLRLAEARVILHVLSKQPLRRTELERLTARKIRTHGTFVGVFYFLVDEGYVQKQGEWHCAAFAVTERGTKLLEALEIPLVSEAR